MIWLIAVLAWMTVIFLFSEGKITDFRRDKAKEISNKTGSIICV